jgi:hypothetical protein
MNMLKKKNCTKPWWKSEFSFQAFYQLGEDAGHYMHARKGIGGKQQDKKYWLTFYAWKIVLQKYAGSLIDI